jgi:hypothetical protein
MSLRQILSLKRAAIQTRIDALSAQENGLNQRLSRLQSQGDGLSLGKAGAAFQIAAMAGQSARAEIARLKGQCQSIQGQRLELAREKLSLDIADRKLCAEEQKLARLDASRAADRA